MSTVIKTSTTTINRSADDVFSELNDNFLDITNWAGGVKSSKANPATPTGFNGSAHGGRVCDVEGVGLTDERVAAFDKERRMISYTVSAEKAPVLPGPTAEHLEGQRGRSRSIHGRCQDRGRDQRGHRVRRRHTVGTHAGQSGGGTSQRSQAVHGAGLRC